jgi:nucleoid-associated protein YgaU
LRAWVDATQRNNEAALASPDITHERTFKAGDKFALLGYRIYNDSNYYLDVARANRMNSFRRIAIGNKIKFPPVK